MCRAHGELILICSVLHQACCDLAIFSPCEHFSHGCSTKQSIVSIAKLDIVNKNPYESRNENHLHLHDELPDQLDILTFFFCQEVLPMKAEIL